MNCYKAINVKSWVDTNLPPLTWNMLAMKISTKCAAKGINVFKLNNEQYLCDEIVESMNFELAMRYNTNIPTSLRIEPDRLKTA